MVLDPKAFSHWTNYFYGYGSWNAPIWFVSYEDGGGDVPEEVAEKLNFFQKVHSSAKEPTLCNIRDLYKQSAFMYDGSKPGKYANLYDYRFGEEARLNGVWRNLIAFEYAFKRRPAPDALEFQKKHFASTGQALIKLLPLPSAHHAWHYSWLDMPEFPYLKSRMLYEEHLYPIRIRQILERLSSHKPELVLMYGMNAINLIKKSVMDYFPQAKFNLVKSVKLKIPQHHRAEISGTTLLLTTQIPALRHNRAETGFDWVEFGKVVHG